MNGTARTGGQTRGAAYGGHCRAGHTCQVADPNQARDDPDHPLVMEAITYGTADPSIFVRDGGPLNHGDDGRERRLVASRRQQASAWLGRDAQALGRCSWPPVAVLLGLLR